MFYEIVYTTPDINEAYGVTDYIDKRLKVDITSSSAETNQPKGSFTYNIEVEGNEDKNKVLSWMRRQKKFSIRKFRSYKHKEV